eukprot:scpid77271/ scgid0065/ 
MENQELHTIDGNTALKDFLKSTLPRANFVKRRTEKEFDCSVEDTLQEATARQRAFSWRQESSKINVPVPFDGVPFLCCGSQVLDCQFGLERRHGEIPLPTTGGDGDTEHSYGRRAGHLKKRIKLQGTRKVGCTASCFIRRIIRFPGYSVNGEATPKEKTAKLEHLRRDLQGASDCGSLSDFSIQERYVVSCPTTVSHTGHDCQSWKGKMAGELSQRLSKEVIQHILQFTEKGLRDARAIQTFFSIEYSKESGRAYHPELKDIRSHIALATHNLQQSRLDQTEMACKIKTWKESATPPALLHFRPYVAVSDPSTTNEDTVRTPNSLTGEEEPCNGRYKGSGGGDDEALIDPVPAVSRLLLVHQEKWQQELMADFGELTLMDATYRTTCYDLALFFIVVYTNVGYIVVAEFCIQSERSEDIGEALAILKANNPTWRPKYFMTDYSEAEMLAIEEVKETATCLPLVGTLYKVNTKSVCSEWDFASLITWWAVA